MSTKKHDVPDALLASLLADYRKPEDLIGENGLRMTAGAPLGADDRAHYQALRDEA